MKLKFVCTFLVLMLAFPAFALDLHGARNSGIVGEKSDGYTAVIGNSPEAQAIVQEVNAKRQQEYARISKQNGQPVDVVAKLAAGEIIKSLPAGNKYQGADGSWKTR